MIMKTNFPILRQIFFAAAPLVLLAGCSDKDAPAPIGVAGVEVSKTTLELALDGTERLTAAVTPDNAADKTLTWSSSDEAVATVNSEGVITAVRAGHATITAAAGGKTGSCAVTVNPDIYTAAMEFLDSELNFIVRKNGEVLYTRPESVSPGFSFFVSGGDVYTTGYENNGNCDVATVWKNDKVLYTLTDGKQNAYASSVFVSGGAVYTAGVEYIGFCGVAKVWKDGTVLHALTDGTQDAEANSVFVSDGVVYTAGYEDNENGLYIAKVWKDDTELHALTDGTQNAEASSFFVSGSDVYTAGRESSENGKPVAKVWKNDKELYTLSDGTQNTYVGSVCVWDGDVYVTVDGIVWKNGTALYSAPESYFGLVSVWDGDVYAAGESRNEPFFKVWKNGAELYSFPVGPVIKLFVYTGPER